MNWVYFTSTVAVLVLFSGAVIFRLMRLNKRLQRDSGKASRAQEEFLANVGHELRTPLTCLKGFTDLILEWSQEDKLTARYSDALRIMKRNEDSLLDTIGSILLFAKLTSGQSTTVNVEDCDVKLLVTDILDSFRPEAKKAQLELVLEISADFPGLLRLNTCGLRHILNNLIQNALKFTPTGTIRVHLNYAKDRSLFIASVEDSGIGISAEQIPKIFNSFYQAHSNAMRSRGGVGLGLSIASTLARQMGGTIKVKSDSGVGSTFSVEIPSTLVAVNSLATASLTEIRPKRVLLVEDSPDSRTVLTVFLKGLVAESVVAVNGREAIEAVLEAEKDGHQFDLVLMDMQMPIMDGYHATKFLRHRGFRRPIIAVTAHNLPGDREKCLRAGCTDYLTKPIDPNNFREKVNQYLVAS